MKPVQNQLLFAMRLLFILLLCSALFASCGGSQSGRIRLVVNSGVEGDALKAAARDYEAATGLHVDVVEFPYDDLFAKELVDLSSGTGAYDLIMLDDPWFPRFATEDLLLDLGPLYQKRGQSGADGDFVSTSIALCKHPYAEGSLRALPYVGNSQLFFYREDLFKKYALKEPDTWEDVLNAARTISEHETAGAPGGGAVYGYVMRAARGNSAVADFMPIFWSFGAEMFDDAGKPAVNSPEGINALKFMIELGKYAPPGYPSFNATEVSAHLLQGTAAMSINWPAWISAFGDPSKSRVIGKVVFTTLPGLANRTRAELTSASTKIKDQAGQGGAKNVGSQRSAPQKSGQAEIGNWLVAIPKGSRNPDAAFEFLLWATSQEQMKKSALAGNPPTRRSLFNDPELVAKFPSYPAQLKSLETSRARPRTPQWSEIENVFGIYLSRANSGELSAEQAMNEANAEIGKIVERMRK